MLRVVDVGVAQITKRKKALDFYGLKLKDDVPDDQDAYLVDRWHNLYAVADGMGSSTHADIAARTACMEYRFAMMDEQSELASEKSDRERATHVLNRMHTAVLGSLALTTFTGLMIDESDDSPVASYLHVGDSQLVLLRRRELIYLTSQHTHADGYRLFNYLGSNINAKTGDVERPTVSLTALPNAFSGTKLRGEWGSITAEDGDRFALMTDGIIGNSEYESLSSSSLKRYLSTIDDAQLCANELLVDSKKIDDSTIVIVDIGR